MRESGTPLGEYARGRFHYGIKTGLNEAFVIDRITRDNLIETDPKSAELIKPWIRGKDIQRWTHKDCDLYIILVRFGFNAELKKYPAILKHLRRHEAALRSRGQCATSRNGSDEGQHHWLELDNNPSQDYLDFFRQHKILIADIGRRLKASYCRCGHHIGNTGYIVVGEGEDFLALLLSKAYDWFARMTFQGLGDPWQGGRMRFINRNLTTFPVPDIDTATRNRLCVLAKDAARFAALNDASNLKNIEEQIDEVVYRLFDLKPDEIELIETTVAAVRHGSSMPEEEETPELEVE